MPHYAYRAKDAAGKTVSGMYAADNPRALEGILAARDLWLLDYHTVARKRGRKVPEQAVIDFCYHMKTVVAAGIPVLEGIDDFCADDQHPLHGVMIDVREQVAGGAQLSQALATHSRTFSDLVSSIIQAGETTGQLDEVLGDLTRYLEWREKLGHQIRSALAYPCVVIVGVVGLCLLLLVYVLPNFLDIFREMNVELPWFTRALLALSDFLIAHGVALSLGAAALFVGARITLRTEGGRLGVHTALLRAPLLGQLITMLEMSRFAHNLAMLYRAGIPIVQSMDMVARIVQNARFRLVIRDAGDALRGGRALAEVLQGSGFVPRIVTRMVKIGEASGELDASLDHVSSYYDRELPRMIDKTLASFNTASVVMLGGVITMMALSIFLPLYQMLGKLNET